ncbi:hypothetical protein [Actinocorallia aurantiaca]
MAPLRTSLTVMTGMSAYRDDVLFSSHTVREGALTEGLVVLL